MIAERKEKPAAVPCQAVSRWDEPCGAPASEQCQECSVWFCDMHFLDRDWHPCAAGESVVP